MSLADYSVAAAAYNALRAADNILILTHIRPDGDTVGSAYALCTALRSLGRTAYMLPGNDASADLGKYYVEYAPPPDFEADYIVACDIASKTLLPPSAEKYASRIDLLIDHHPHNSLEAKVRAVEGDAAAAGEVIRELIVLFGLALDKKSAEGIFVALCTDTGCFKYSNTRAETHIYAADAIIAGADTASICRTFFGKVSRGRIALENAVLSSISFYAEGRIAVTKLSRKTYAECGADTGDIEGISSLAVSVDGVEVGIFCREIEGKIKCSVRTDLYVSAYDICSAFGGGGHVRASGCTLETSLDEAERLLVREAMKYIGGENA